MKYRKKPVVIEAFQYNEINHNTELPDWAIEAFKQDILYFKTDLFGVSELFIHTLEGEMKVSPGDFVIQGVQGELYPCKPDIFEQTYEAAE